MFSTVISKEDYDRMSGVLNESMNVNDDFYAGMAMPTEVVIDTSDDDEPDFELEIVPKKQEKSNKRKPIVSEHVPMESLAPTYRPSYTPPTFTKPEEKIKPVVEVDVSKVKEGATVYHKSFGEGIVVALEKDIIRVVFVDFDNKEKQFNFPGAFMDGFLSL